MNILTSIEDLSALSGRLNAFLAAGTVDLTAVEADIVAIKATINDLRAHFGLAKL